MSIVVHIDLLFDSSPAVNCLRTAICCRSLTIRRGGAKSAATDPRRLFVRLAACSNWNSRENKELLIAVIVFFTSGIIIGLIRWTSSGMTSFFSCVRCRHGLIVHHDIKQSYLDRVEVVFSFFLFQEKKKNETHTEFIHWLADDFLIGIENLAIKLFDKLKISTMKNCFF